MILDLANPQTYFPERTPRRGELIAWVLAVVLGVTWVILWLNDGLIAGAALVLAIFILISALVISLNNWMERNTSIRLSEQGVAFRNGLRDVSIPWPEVESVRVLPGTGKSKRVQVIGNRVHFEFRTLSVMKYKGEVQARTGFTNGEAIQETIIARARLQPQNPGEMIVYYARE